MWYAQNSQRVQIFVFQNVKIIQPLTFLFNESIHYEIVPDKLKLEVVYQMLKARKIKSIASISILANLFKNYFRVQKYGDFLRNRTKITVFCWSSQQSTL